jgi:hypothetical protein
LSPETWVELGALGLGLWATWLSRPVPLKRDWEHIFKLALSNAMLAAQGEGPEAEERWLDEVHRRLPYHPAGRQPEQKLERPELDAIPTPALPHERALVEALARLPDPAARYRWMYQEDPIGPERLVPEEGPGELDPRPIFGPEAGWEELGRGGPAWRAGLQRRFQHLRVVGSGASPLAEALSAELPAIGPPLRLDPQQAAQASADGLLEALGDPQQRVLLIAGPGGLRPALDTLLASPALRDRLAAFISLGAEIQGPDQAAWMTEHFTHTALDTELRRIVPYMAVVDLDPAQPLGRSWSAQRFPQPLVPPSGAATISAEDLGPLPLSLYSPAELARALWILLGFRLS